MGVIQSKDKKSYNYSFVGGEHVEASSVPFYRDVYDEFVQDHFGHSYGRYIYVGLNTSDNSLVVGSDYIVKNTEEITKQVFTDWVSARITPANGIIWYFAYGLFTQTFDSSKDTPQLVQNYVFNSSYRVGVSGPFEHSFSNFKFKVSTICDGVAWSELQIVADSGKFTNTNIEGQSDFEGAKQPSVNWWSQRKAVQRVTFSGEVSCDYYIDERIGFNSALDIVGTSLSGLTSILDTPLIGGLSIGAVISIPLALSLIVMLLKALKS